jgi:hypothetical protein
MFKGSQSDDIVNKERFGDDIEEEQSEGACNELGQT